MSNGVALVALKCVRCETPVPAEAGEVAWACAECGQGLLLDEASGLSALEIHYASSNTPEKMGRPFWVSEGRVVLERVTYRRSSRDEKQAGLFWESPRRFFIPAFASQLEPMIDMAAALLMRAPQLQPGPAVPFAPVTLSRADVHALAEFVVVSIEAERRDQLRTLAFHLELETPDLWVLP